MRPAEALRYTVLAVQREGDRRLSEQLAPLGISTAQAEVIRVLADHGPLTLAGLGGLLVCEGGGSPSRLVDRLVRIGLVDRVPSATDRRTVILSLTPRGSDASARVADVERRLYEQIDRILAPERAEDLTAQLRGLLGGSQADVVLARRTGRSTQHGVG